MEAKKGSAAKAKGVPVPSKKVLLPSSSIISSTSLLPISLSTSTLPCVSTAPNTSIEPLPGSDAIGHSYDTFEYFANPRSTMKELFQFACQKEIMVEGRTWLLSSDFEYTAIRDTETLTLSNRSKDFYSRELAVGVKLEGSYNSFSASVQADFSQSVTDETDTTYTSVRTNVNKWRLRLKDDVVVLRSKLLPAFKQALASMEVTELLDTYGAYYLSEVLVGGRADYVACTRSSAFSSTTKISAAAKASFMDIAGGEVSAEYKQLVKTLRENSITRLYALGGSALSNITDSGAYNAWLKSIDTLPVFCGFTRNSLRPIWELADTSQRREALRKATKSYIPAYVTRPAIVGLEVIVSESYSESPPYGYTKIGYDLNRNAGGKYVFLCYKQHKISVAGSAGDPDPITDILVIYGDDPYPAVPSGYVKINKDLNSGSGGKYIYFCYSKDKSKQEESLPIRGLRVVGADVNAVAPYAFTKIAIDLNMDAGGDYIYLCKSRHLE